MDLRSQTVENQEKSREKKNLHLQTLKLKFQNLKDTKCPGDRAKQQDCTLKISMIHL